MSTNNIGTVVPTSFQQFTPTPWQMAKRAEHGVTVIGQEGVTLQEQCDEVAPVIVGTGALAWGVCVLSAPITVPAVVGTTLVTGAVVMAGTVAYAAINVVWSDIYERFCQEPQNSVDTGIASLTTPEQANLLGYNYLTGTGVLRDYNKAWKCFKKAIEVGPRYGFAYRNIGVMIENGTLDARSIVNEDCLSRNGIDLNGSPNDVLARLYQKAIDLACRLDNENFARQCYDLNLPKNERKAIEIDRIVCHWRGGRWFLYNYLNRSIQNPTNAIQNLTPLQRMLNHGQASLVVILRQCFYRHISNHPPLDIAQDGIISPMQNRINKLITHFKRSPAEALFRAITNTNRDDYLNIFSVALFNELYNYPELQPIMDLVPWMTAGCHKLSGQEQYRGESQLPNCFNEAFDTDSIGPTNRQQKLQINLVWGESITSLHCPPIDARVGGLVRLGYPDSIRNAIPLAAYVPYDQGIAVGTRGLLFHELAHYVAWEVFQNNCLPYRQGDQVSKDKYTQVINTLKQRNATPGLELHDKIREVFNHPVYNGSNIPADNERNHHVELIVRVPHILVMLGNRDGLALLQSQAPTLLQYYIEDFISAVRIHTQKLERVTFEGFPLKMLIEESRLNGH